MNSSPSSMSNKLNTLHSSKTSSVLEEHMVTHVLWIGDCSGSMWNLVHTHQTGFNQLLSNQAARTESNCTVLMGLLTFNTHYTLQYMERPVNECSTEPISTFQASGSTLLYDTISHGIELMKHTMDRINQTDPYPENHTYMIEIMTDGEDTCSNNHTQSSIGKLIEQYQTDYEWIFNFFAANQNAETVGSSMNIRKDRCVTFTPQVPQMESLMRRVSENVTRCSQGVTRGFTEEEKYECSPMDYSQVSTQQTITSSFDTGVTNAYQNNEFLFQTPTQTQSSGEYNEIDNLPSPPRLNRTKTSLPPYYYDGMDLNGCPLPPFTQPDFDMELSDLGSQELVNHSEVSTPKEESSSPKQSADSNQAIDFLL